MKPNLKGSIPFKLVAISALFLFSGMWLNVAACLVPLKVLLAYDSYEHELQVEDRRHNLALLNFRDQQRAVEAKFSKAMIDCTNTPPEQNCAAKAAAEEMTAIKGIQKREVDENQLHLSKLDKLATYYAFGKHQ